jgi:hypothetical protein
MTVDPCSAAINNIGGRVARNGCVHVLHRAYRTRSQNHQLRVSCNHDREGLYSKFYACVLKYFIGAAGLLLLYS